MASQKRSRLVLLCMLCALCCFSTGLIADTPLKILFIGNSFTNQGPVPSVVRSLALDAGWAGPDVTNVAVDGETLSFHSTNANTLAAIDQGGWDYVVLQEYSTKPTDNAGDPAGFKADATFLYDRVKASSPAAHIILYETWARHEDHDIYPGTFTDRTQMQTQLITHYHDCVENYIPANSTFAVKTDVRLAPAGEAWHANYLDQNLMLHGSDLYHASSLGQYLNSMAIYSIIYHRMVAGLNPQLGISSADATYLQTICDTVTGETIPQPGTEPNDIEPGEIIYVDFGSSSTTTPGNWNNLTSSSGGINDVMNSDGNVTRVDLAIPDRFNAINESGTTTPDPVLGLPSEATRDSFFGNDVLFNGLVEPTGQVVISDLDPSLVYRLSVFASRMGATDNRQTQYAISGEGGLIETLYLNPAGNTDTDVQSRAIQPTASGDIIIDIQKGPNNNNSYGFTYMGTLTIKACGGGDVDCDGQVQLADVRTIALNWLDITGLAYWDQGDITLDGNIDLSDIAELYMYWLTVTTSP